MGFRFRRTVKIAPGFRVNVGKRGSSLSIGERGATVNVSGRGTRTTVGVPGTGVSYSTSSRPAGARRGGGVWGFLFGLLIIFLLIRWLGS